MNTDFYTLKPSRCRQVTGPCLVRHFPRGVFPTSSSFVHHGHVDEITSIQPSTMTYHLYLGTMTICIGADGA